MNRVMLNFTPDLKPSRKSIVGTFTASPLATSSTKVRRRYSLAVDASLSVTINGKPSEQTASLGRSSSQPVPGTPGATKKRMSLHENMMMKILATPVDQPLAEEGFESASELSLLSSLAEEDPISSEEKLLIESDVLLRCYTPPNLPLDCPNNPRLARLYKDLQSPSATTRLRALRALKSPSKREAYGQFDVPHEEQDIITAEERQMPRPKTIQELMAGVCIYVEVRSGTDNRSDGIRDHLVSLGAKVNDKLYKDTTHVIFKDGLLSTYQKAKKMNVPVVSILWIEACKRHLCLMNPDSYPISNVERYENPELFKKIRVSLFE
ncbi:AAEL009349-PA [Aedes aegypti]|uniref:AAEL009349-PA n=1 Tax=Aedes aegypti TaxID=7159 RepID=Q16W28_AEDAE|nr:AAEL009349-PA [Aedes aegypti]